MPHLHTPCFSSFLFCVFPISVSGFPFHHPIPSHIYFLAFINVCVSSKLVHLCRASPLYVDKTYLFFFTVFESHDSEINSLYPVKIDISAIIGKFCVNCWSLKIFLHGILSYRCFIFHISLVTNRYLVAFELPFWVFIFLYNWFLWIRKLVVSLLEG